METKMGTTTLADPFTCSLLASGEAESGGYRYLGDLIQRP
jgi:hypothetical protein